METTAWCDHPGACRVGCQNIAYTDRDVADLRTRAAELREITTDYLPPSLRHHRERAELARIETIIRTHEGKQR